MASPLKSLLSDDKRYMKAYQLFLECSNEHQCMQDIIKTLLPDILTSIVNGKSHLNIIGVGSGSGELDLMLLSALHLKNPEMTVDNEVVEPHPKQHNKYKDLVSQTPGLNYIKFNWNNMTADEFEEQWKEKKRTKKADLIHMFHMLYYMKDVEATISFYHSLLDKNGKLLISLVPDDSGWAKLRKTYGKQLCYTKNISLTTEVIKRYLDSKGLSYTSYMLPAHLDITECFTEGDEKGELLLDFLTHVLHFSKSASPELKAGIMEFLRLDCTEESNGKVLFNSDFEVIIVDQLS